MGLHRRSLLTAGMLAGAALPFLRRPGFAASADRPLRFGLSSYPPSFQPWVQAGTAAGTVNLLVNRGLIAYDAAGDLRGELAESWARDGDAGWRFHLREAFFHNGAPVTAEDVKWSIEQVAAEKSTAYMRGQFQGVDRIETPDARTVRIIMKQPTATVPLWLAAYEMPVIAKDSLDHAGVGVGCGPYVITAQDRGVSLDLSGFDRFYRPGLPKVKTLRIIVYADETARVAALQAGDVDLIEYVPWQSMAGIEADPKLKLLTTNGPFMYVTFNGNFGPFADPRIRRAVGHAINREEIVKSVFFGRGSPLEGLPILPGSAFYDEKLAHGWNYDPARAKQLLAEAGKADGFACTLLATAQYGMHKDTAVLMQQHLAAIGIQVTLSLPDWPTRVALGNRGQYEFAVGGTTTDGNDPDGLAPLLDGALGASMARSPNIATPKLTALFAAGRGEFDETKRRAIYNSLQQEAIEQTPATFLAWRSQGYAMAHDVQGFTNLPGALTFLSGLTLEDTSFA
jgi:peptide/nickel transport system substrate-binding protein